MTKTIISLTTAALAGAHVADRILKLATVLAQIAAEPVLRHHGNRFFFLDVPPSKMIF